MRRLFVILCALSMPAAIAAAMYDTKHLPYSDAPSDTETAVAVSTLTEEGIVQGYTDGTFKPQRLVNRAEFLKMAMRAGGGEVLPIADTTCFVDVPPASWYAPFVCAAKRDGIVSGNALVGVSSLQWTFDPLRPVQYEEALKMLVKVYGLPSLGQSGEAWYDRYFRIANERGVGLQTWAGHRLTRAETARLVVAF
ncbi:MAG: S-layer homology domain-containing protein, partial [Candidatus Peribacteraceae bacterium]|nr:S-layer homology domain-containing protein [Candidatus Peribacteraceae bacterium]